MNGVPSLTDQQRLAVETRDVSIALSAGAGCGKTFVLTERFLSSLQWDAETGSKPPELRQLVAITFTEAAAREMRDRIRRRCYQKLQTATGAAQTYWQSLLRSIDRARISTIDSYCGTLLRTHAVEAGIDPQFIQLDAPQAQTLLAEITDDYLRTALSARQDDVIDLVEALGVKKLSGGIFNLVNQRNPLQFAQWRTKSAEQLVALWDRYARTEMQAEILEQFLHSQTIRDLIDSLNSTSHTHPVFLERKECLLGKLAGLKTSKTVAHDLEEIREAAKIVGAGTAKKWPAPEEYQAFKSAAEATRKLIDKIRPQLEFDANACLPAAELGLKLLNLACEVMTAYDKAKAESCSLDFLDLLLQTNKLLSDPNHSALQKNITSQIDLLMVDEFQDTNAHQVELVKTLCGQDIRGGKLFFVGDSKQSIYRFRGALPAVFHQLREEVPEQGKLPLTLNFRSQPAIIDFVNVLFGQHFEDSYESLQAHRPQVAQPPSVEFLWAQGDAAEQSGNSRRRDHQEEADWIARRIRSMLESGQPLVYQEPTSENEQATARPPQAGDFAILFRALSDVQHYEEALRRYEIDYYLEGGHAFYSQQEVYDVLNLLRAVSSLCDDISLAGLLRSPFFGLSDEALFWLAQHPQGLRFALFAGETTGNLSDVDARQTRFAAETLTYLREIKDRVPIATLLAEALERTGYDAALVTEFLGERKLANLEKIIDQARSFDASNRFGLDDFIVQLDRFVAEHTKEALAATQAEATNVVKLMTIHKSKGLEFPIVVVPDLERRRFSRVDSISFSPELGPIVAASRPNSSDARVLLQSRYQREEEAEDLRLFYVACTRAADYLLLASDVRDIDKPQGAWTRWLADCFDLSTGKCRLPSVPEAALPEVRVTLEKPKLQTAAKSARPRSQLSKALKTLTSEKRASISDGPPEMVAAIPISFRNQQRFSFSQLSPYLTGESAMLSVESSAGEMESAPQAVDPLLFGSLLHNVLQQFPFADDATVRTLVQRNAKRLFRKQSALVIDEATALVEQFRTSDRAMQLGESQARYAEIEFLLAWPPAEFSSANCYLEGVIDSLYQDREGGWHILDYKTNRVSQKNIDSVAETYHIQMAIYALAVEQSLKTSVRSLTLFFLRGGLEYSFPWNDTIRTAASERIDTAIEKLRQGS